MRRLAVVLGIVLALASGTAAAQYRHELSFFGAYDKVDEPEDFTLSIFNLRYGHYLTEQIVATLGLNRTNFDTRISDSTTTALTGGIKYYFTQVAQRGLVPFAEAAIGFAMVDTGVDDSTDLTWEIGGGAAYFITESTSIDASLRWYQTDTDGGDTEGLRLFVGMTARF
jgi:opacity protein-like surface antigen